MSYLRLRIPVKAFEAYLYGGYLFLFMQDGSLRFAKFDDLLWEASEGSVEIKKHLQLSFLPHQYLKGSTYRFLYSFKSLRDIIDKEQSVCIKKGDIYLEKSNIQNRLISFGDFDDLPFDVCVYGGELFFASDAGVHRYSLNTEIDYSIHPKCPYKIIDCPAVRLTAKAGMLAISAKEEGLFSHDIFSKEYQFMKDTPAYDKMSIKAEWSTSYTLINYSDLCHFTLLENDVEEKKTERFSHLPHNYRKDVKGKKLITAIGKKYVGMKSLMINTDIDTEDLIYTFNTQSSGFFFFKDGSLQVRNIKSNNDSYHYSSRSVHESDISASLGKKRPLSAIAIPNGCIVETYDKVFLIRQNEVTMIADEPVYGIRSYLSSNNYRNLASIVYNNYVEIIAFPQLPSPYNSYDHTFRPGYLKDYSRNDEKPESNLPF